ncbi:hypothetical protein D3C78_1606240 [compost metagenome]
MVYNALAGIAARERIVLTSAKASVFLPNLALASARFKYTSAKRIIAGEDIELVAPWLENLKTKIFGSPFLFKVSVVPALY